MAATANPPTQAVAEWCKVFHTQGTESYTSSVTFMKQLTVVAMSTITYLKNALPEDSYTVETFAGLQLKILKNKCKDELSQFLSTALSHALEALDKKYLNQLALCFYENQCQLDNLIEYHVFEYTYNNDAVSMNIRSKNKNEHKNSLKCSFEDIKEKTTSLLRTCLVMMQTCPQQLPPSTDISIRLYYNDEAPEGYQAPGFTPGPSGPDHLAPSLSRALRLGAVQTDHHRLSASSYFMDLPTDSNEALPSQNPPSMTLTQQCDFSDQKSVSDASEVQICCPCNKYDNTEKYPSQLITCTYCGLFQHGVCFGVRGAVPPPVHCCTSCSDRGRPPTDPRLAALSHMNRECLCIFRRTLDWCTELPAIDGASLVERFGISNVNASKLLKLLDSYGIINLDPNFDLVTPKAIYPEPLQVQIGKYFLSDDSNLADRLLAETFGSQESKQDPIGDVLSPIEKLNLQAANIGKVIDNDIGVKMDETGDETLRQYREAILSGDMDELPIAASVDLTEKAKGGNKRMTKRKINDVTPSKEKKLRTGVRNKKARGNVD